MDLYLILTTGVHIYHLSPSVRARTGRRHRSHFQALLNPSGARVPTWVPSAVPQTVRHG
jgi:hypothetical protein